MDKFSRDIKVFFANFSATFLIWLVYNTAFFTVYFMYCLYRANDEHVGREIVDIVDFKVNIVLSVIVSVLLVLLLICSFLIGKKSLSKCRNPVLTVISCFSSYIIIAVAIWRSSVLIEFTQSYLAIVLPTVFTRISDFAQPLTDCEYEIWQTELMYRSGYCSELITSANLNNLFALLPFTFSYIGINQGTVQHRGTVLFADKNQQSGDG